MAVSKSEAETYKYADKVYEKIKNGGLVCLFGDLGTGKTIFAKGIAHAFGIDHFTIKSPTYTYIRKYENNNRKFYHIDLYRLEKIDELMAQEIGEIFMDKKAIIIIEWADKMTEYLPDKRIDICLEYLDENSRKITIFE